MLLKTIRENRMISRQQLAEDIGISIRTIQDYEQNHKDLHHAGFDTVEKICACLGCTADNLFSSEPEEAVIKKLQETSFYSSEYKIYGCWHQSWNGNQVVFMYDKQIRHIEFNAKITREYLSCMQGIAVMMMERLIEDSIGEERWQTLRTTF